MRVKGCIYSVVIAAMLGGSALSAQEITINWADKSIKSAPTEIHKGDTVKVTVTNVNNILYDYKVNVSLQTGSSDDLALVGKLLGGDENSRALPPSWGSPVAHLRRLQLDLTCDRELISGAA